jgi:fatty acid desaturase
MNILQDKRLRLVSWRDLTRMSFKEKLIENALPLPWLLLSWTLAYYHYYLLALPFSFIFFLAGLRQVHNGFHYTLGTSKNATWVTLFINSLLMLAAMHAVKYNHLRHHKYCLQDSDEEGRCAKMNAFKAVAYGPVFIFRMHRSALLSKNRNTVRNTAVELLAMAVLVTLAVLSGIHFLLYHIIAMTAGEFLTAFFAVWTVHHDCDEHIFARTLSNRWKNRLTYNMFFHLEHHLFPGVPTIKLPELSERIKEQLPDIKPKEVF